MILREILASKAREVEAAKAARDEASLRALPGFGEPRRGFAAALGASRARHAVIAEIKKASPSAGVIRADFDAARHARAYEQAGACCLSVLTDAPFFQGSLADLEAARRATRIPLLRKDFVLDAYQIVEARAHGADAVLLIVAALAPDRLRELMAAAATEGLDVLVEVHDRAELTLALDAGAKLVGVNNRNLATFEVSLTVTRQLAGLVPDDVVLVSESGFRHPHELMQLEALGVNAFLIGEAFMRAPEPGAALAAFLAG